MADALIIYAGEKEAVAQRLRESLAAAGYAVELGRAGRGALAVGDAGAALVLWSKAAMASDPVNAAAAEAARGGRLIEASADGIAPVAGIDDNRVALLSGWRGEPHHPGWQRILSELKRMSAPSRPAAAPAAVAPSAAPGTAAAPARPASASRGMPAMVVAALVLLLIGVAAAAWLTTSSPSVDPNASLAPPEPRREPESTRARPSAPSESAGELAAPPAAPVPASAGKSRAAAAAAPKATPQSRSASNMRLFCAGAGRETPQCRTWRQQAPAERPASAALTGRRQESVRYRNSRNMRLFCERAGRRTPECRRFRREAAKRD